jgi:hypothetical protein
MFRQVGKSRNTDDLTKGPKGLAQIATERTYYENAIIFDSLIRFTHLCSCFSSFPPVSLRRVSRCVKTFVLYIIPLTPLNSSGTRSKTCTCHPLLSFSNKKCWSRRVLPLCGLLSLPLWVTCSEIYTAET